MMITSKGYFGGKWHARITDYQSYLNARRLRKWKLEDPKNRQLILTPQPRNVSMDNMYFTPPALILDQHYNMIKPDVNNVRQAGFAPSGVREIEVRCEMVLPPGVRKRNHMFYDSEGMIGVPF